MAFRKSIKAEDIKEDDDIILYYHASPSSQSVKQLYFHVDSISDDNLTLRCTRLKKDGTTFRDRWYDIETPTFKRYNEDNDRLFTNYYTKVYGTYYLRPDIPCKLVINQLIEEKKKINKTIIDCQHLMYSVE